MSSQWMDNLMWMLWINSASVETADFENVFLRLNPFLQRRKMKKSFWVIGRQKALTVCAIWIAHKCVNNKQIMVLTGLKETKEQWDSFNCRQKLAPEIDRTLIVS